MKNLLPPLSGFGTGNTVMFNDLSYLKAEMEDMLMDTPMTAKKRRTNEIAAM